MAPPDLAGALPRRTRTPPQDLAHAFAVALASAPAPKRAKPATPPTGPEEQQKADDVAARIGGELGETRCVGARVDWLTIAFRIAWTDQASTYTAERTKLAAERIGGKRRSRVAFELGALVAELRTNRGSGAVTFENADLRGRIDSQAPGHWSVSIDFRATYLATHTVLAALAYADRIARSFGRIQAGRLRRVDLAADFAGWPLLAEDGGALVKPSRASQGAWTPEAKDMDGFSLPALREYRRGAGQITGWTVCPGNPLQCRIYDKTAELALQSPDKAAIERAGWSRYGWHDDERVTRVEFQLRGEALDELELRTPTALLERIDPIWQYLCRKWVRLVVPDSASRLSRAALDPRWTAVQTIRFYEHKPPAVRVRRSAAASARQALGCILSGLAARGELQRFESENGSHDEDQITADWTAEAARTFTASTIEQYAAGFVRLVLAELDPEHPHETATALVGRVNAAVARFHSDDTPPKPPTWPRLADLEALAERRAIQAEA